MIDHYLWSIIIYDWAKYVGAIGQDDETPLLGSLL